MIRPRISSSIAAAFVLASLAAPLFGDVFPVDVSKKKFTLYTDPNTGKKVKMGGFSGLANVKGDHSGRIFWSTTDRGPNVDLPSGSGKLFVDPEFTPTILQLQLRRDGTGRVVREIPMSLPNGQLASGRANTCVVDETPVVDLHNEPIVRDPDGLDIEGIAVGPHGEFWACEEYRPSVLMISREGQVVLRLVPQGDLCGGEVIPTFDILPRVYAKRVSNRGLEGVDITCDGFLYAVEQRPLANPDKAASEASRNIRVLEIDTEKVLHGEGGAVKQYLYLTDGKASKSVYASDLHAFSRWRLLVPERKTDKVFAADFSAATDITPLEDADGNLVADPTKTIEQLGEADLAAMGIVPATKTEAVASLIALDPGLEKCEGIVVSRGNIVLCGDNDFDLLAPDFSTNPATLIFQNPPNPPKVVTTPLPAFLKDWVDCGCRRGHDDDDNEDEGDDD